MRFFSYDSKFGRLFLKVSYACCLNFLWLICCLPIFTIGASTTALFYTSFKIAKDEGSFITTMFFRSFRQNFKQATIIWLIMLVTGLIIGADAILLYRLHLTTTGTAAVVWTLLLAVIFACMVLYVIVLVHIFPLLSIASNTTANMFKNAFLIGTHYLFVTILVVFVHYAMFFLVVNVFTPLIVLGEGMCAIISAHILLKILRPMLQDPNAPPKDEAQGNKPQENELQDDEAAEYGTMGYGAMGYGPMGYGMMGNETAGNETSKNETTENEIAENEVTENGAAQDTPGEPEKENGL